MRNLVLFLVGSALCGPLLIGYVVDPLQVFRKAAYRPFLSANQRYQNPGLIRHYPYDTIITGTSLVENFYPSYVNAALGVEVLKVPVRGSTAHEQFLTAQLALRTGKAKRVIWGIDHWVFCGPPDGIAQEGFPAYLYGAEPLPYVQYLFNISTFLDSLRLVATWQIFEPHGDNSLERLYAWDQTVTFGAEWAMRDFDTSMPANDTLASLDTCCLRPGRADDQFPSERGFTDRRVPPRTI